MSKKIEFQYLARAYFEAANQLQKQQRVGAAKTKTEKLLPIPTAHLTCHGIELALKSNLLYAGIDIERLASSEFGHDLLKLWSQPMNTTLRQKILALAPECWIDARESGLWSQQREWDEDPTALLERTLGELNDLHTRVSNYALRYGTTGATTNSQMIIPKTNLIRSVFERQMLTEWPVL